MKGASSKTVRVFQKNELNIEAEIISLRAIIEMINSMVNKAMIELRGKDPDTELVFHTFIHQKLFYIILVDFLSPFDSNLVGKKGAAVDLLKSICEEPSFEFENSMAFLKESVTVFSDWINKEIVREKTWFPAINRELDLKIKRWEFIKICGNISKHNFARLTGTYTLLKNILKRNGVSEIAPDAMNMLLDEFYEQFHEDVLNYHNSCIAEMLNNIRWGIHEYLFPEFIRSYTQIGSDSFRYEYKYPKQIQPAYAKSCYWDLMNDVRSKPYLKKFKVTKYLKMRY